MVRATYQTRLSAIILGIRPTVAHVYGSTDRTPADNLTLLGIEAWRVGLRQLHTDLCAADSITAGEEWIHEWVATEIQREEGRWGDASTLLELLAVSLGPAAADPTRGPRSRLFWDQWQRNLSHHLTIVGTGASAPTHDTRELLDHASRLVFDHNGPQTLIDDLAALGRSLGAVESSPAPFRPLSSAVERLQLSTILASAYDDGPTCSAAMAKLLEQRAPSLPCHIESNRRHRLGGWRYRAATPGH